MRNHSSMAAAVVAALLLCTAPSMDSQGTERSTRFFPLPPEVHGAMYDFLQGWLVDDSQQKTMKHFSASKLQVAPQAVWRASQKRFYRREDTESAGKESLSRGVQDAYWKLLRDLRPADLAVLPEVLDYIAPNLRMFVESDELDVPIVHDDKFIVFVADRAVELDSFDGGYGNVSSLLRPGEARPTLTMIADFQRRNYDGYEGPFVAFWGEERADGVQAPVWRILALGAVPDEMVWNDGRR